jgi:Zn-dependent M28 family amino/carboxypeptidase
VKSRLAYGLLLLAAGCAAEAGTTDAAQEISGDSLLAKIRVLASDEFEGRGPGTPGEEKTVAYLTEQFQQLGLSPGNPDGSWVQQVAMVGITSTPEVTFTAGGKPLPIRIPDDLSVATVRQIDQIAIDQSDIVFVGYGIEAPEYQWDDWKGTDVRGKTVIMLVNDPPIPDPADSAGLDSSLFRGKAMTYYGRWTYKYEIASAKGAAAAIIVHEEGPAGYPWEVAVGVRGRENADIARPDSNRARVPVEGWMHLDKTRQLFRAAGQDFDALKRAAMTREFQPVRLDARATFRIKTSVRSFASRNVMAKLEGSDPALRDELVIYTTHWDHLGRDTTLTGDQIYNGAHDNASGTAGVLEIARAFTALQPRPKRSILFLAVTAEEKGLLGAKYYAENPLYPLNRTLADINIDGLNQWGPTSDITLVGYGNSTLDDLIAGVAGEQQRTIKPDPEPEKGYFYRSDHFEFAKKGVPALYTHSGIDFIGKPADYGKQKRQEYVANDYHKPSDEVKPDWDLTGAVNDLRLFFEVGQRIADGTTWPEWRPGTEFRAEREKSLKN